MGKYLEKSSQGITVRIIADSVNPAGVRLTTWELEYPRMVHSELMTHRVFSRNAASSRAIPVKKLRQRTLDEIMTPVHWGANMAGMQAKQQLTGFRLKVAQAIWKMAGLTAVGYAYLLDKAGLHKQLANRGMETYHNIKVVVTSTEWNNWYWLRDHSDAQPEIHVLASLMKQCHDQGEPEELREGEVHLPYIDKNRATGELSSAGVPVTLEDAIKISCSCCAQVSYRLLNQSIEKALFIYDKLVTSTPVHASPFEHVARVPMYNLKMNNDQYPETWEDGFTHADREGGMWSNNFREWIQFRAIM